MDKISMVGTATFSVRYGLLVLPAFTFQVSVHGAKLFGFSILDNLGTTILMVATPWLHCWPSLFAGLVCLTTFDDQPLVDPNVSPVIQPLQQLPLACVTISQLSCTSYLMQASLSG